MRAVRLASCLFAVDPASCIERLVIKPIDFTTSRIRARSRRQAMDWSLVLVSQSIESTIDFNSEEGWGLVVSSLEYERAVEAIRLYREENPRWPWRGKIQETLLFDWASLGWVFLIVLFYQLDERGLDLRSGGLMDGAEVARGQWWRLFTAMFLHADVAHLVANAGFGLVLLGMAMGMQGTGIGLLSAYLAGAGGNLIACILDPGHRSLGASGMVMACLGLLSLQAIPVWRKQTRPLKSALIGIVAGLMLFLLLGSDPGTDLIAHAGGFGCGLGLAAILALTPHARQSAPANSVAAGAFSFLLVLTWWLALRHRG